jgi:hypothetical protein
MSVSAQALVGRRFANWPERLAAFLESRRVSPKQWGVNDCGLFCADAIEAMTGVDMAEELRGHDSARGSLKGLVRYLERRGVWMPKWREHPGSLLCEVARLRFQVFGCPEIQACMAQRGDAVLLDVADLMPPEEYIGKPLLHTSRMWTVSLGIIGMAGLPVTAGLDGVVTLGAERIIRAWRI